MSRTLNSLIRVAAIVVALNATTAMAQSDWTGTWDSRYGELRLVQEGERVYGDYANRGYFEGRVSENGDRLRGTFQYNNPRSKNGYIEFVRSGASFTGGWNWARNGVASFETGNWTGTLKSSARPILRYAARRDDYWADFWPDTNVQVKGWAYEGSIIDEEQAAPALYGYSDIRGDEWQGTFTTNYGDLRLVQVGRAYSETMQSVAILRAASTMAAAPCAVHSNITARAPSRALSNFAPMVTDLREHGRGRDRASPPAKAVSIGAAHAKRHRRRRSFM